MSKFDVFTTRPLAYPDWPTTTSQPVAIVAASSRAAAARAFTAAGAQVTSQRLKEYGGITSNARQIEIATTEPGTVFITESSSPNAAYVALRPREA